MTANTAALDEDSHPLLKKVAIAGVAGVALVATYFAARSECVQNLRQAVDMQLHQFKPGDKGGDGIMGVVNSGTYGNGTYESRKYNMRIEVHGNAVCVTGELTGWTSGLFPRSEQKECTLKQEFGATDLSATARAESRKIDEPDQMSPAMHRPPPPFAHP